MNTAKLKGPENCCKWRENIKVGFYCIANLESSKKQISAEHWAIFIKVKSICPLTFNCGCSCWQFCYLLDAIIQLISKLLGSFWQLEPYSQFFNFWFILFCIIQSTPTPCTIRGTQWLQDKVCSYQMITHNLMHLSQKNAYNYTLFAWGWGRTNLYR